MGGTPERQPRYRDTSPIELLAFGVQQAFFTGQMFAAHSAPYAAAVKRAGDAGVGDPVPERRALRVH